MWDFHLQCFPWCGRLNNSLLKTSTSQPPEPVNTLTYIARALQLGLSLAFGDGEMILDDPHEPSNHSVILREKQKDQGQRKEMLKWRGSERKGNAPLLALNMERNLGMLTISRSWRREGSKDKKADSPWSLQSGMQPYQHLDFSKVGRILYSDVQRTIFCWVKPLRL